jgi:hypothetical protein
MVLHTKTGIPLPFRPFRVGRLLTGTGHSCKAPGDAGRELSDPTFEPRTELELPPPILQWVHAATPVLTGSRSILMFLVESAGTKGGRARA